MNDDFKVDYDKQEQFNLGDDFDEEENIKPLHSVGCVIVTEGVGLGMTYPMLVDGSWETNQDMGVHIDDCSDEWYDALSLDDMKIVLDVDDKESK